MITQHDYQPESDHDRPLLPHPRLHIGYSGTRDGMSVDQLETVRLLLQSYTKFNFGFCAHHGDCIGGDQQFHKLCRELQNALIRIVSHPGPGPLRAFCKADEILPPKPFPDRNHDIVKASGIMIATPLKDEPQPRGGTWQTIALARSALKRHLQELYVIGRRGQLLDHTKW